MITLFHRAKMRSTRFIFGRLERGPYLLGERFSALDVLYGTTFALFAGSPLLPPSQDVSRYVERVTSRPAFQRAARLDA